jgi:hypothetical protein
LFQIFCALSREEGSEHDIKKDCRKIEDAKHVKKVIERAGNIIRKAHGEPYFAPLRSILTHSLGTADPIASSSMSGHQSSTGSTDWTSSSGTNEDGSGITLPVSPSGKQDMESVVETVTHTEVIRWDK